MNVMQLAVRISEGKLSKEEATELLDAYVARGKEIEALEKRLEYARPFLRRWLNKEHPIMKIVEGE